MNNTLHIRAVGDLRCPFVGADGVPVPGRYAGRARKTFEALPDGEHVPDCADHRRAVARGDLALVVAKPAPSAPALAAAVDTTAADLGLDPLMGSLGPILGPSAFVSNKEHDQ